MTSREGEWAKPVEELHVTHDLPAGAANVNLEGHRVVDRRRQWKHFRNIKTSAALRPVFRRG